MRNTKGKKGYREFVPLVLALVLILGLTLQKTSDNVELSEKCRKAAVAAAEKIGIETRDAWWNTAAHFRKTGHVVEYFFLGICVGYAIKRFILSTFICIAVSIFDQALKFFVPVRHFDGTDLVFDAAGYVIGILMIMAAMRVIRDNGHL